MNIRFPAFKVFVILYAILLVLADPYHLVISKHELYIFWWNKVIDCCQNAHKQVWSTFVKQLNRTMDHRLNNYDSILFIVRYNEAPKMHAPLSGPFLSLPSATKLRKLCFYRCLSVDRGGLPQCMLGYPLEQTPQEQHPPPPPGTRHPPRPGTPSDQAPLEPGTPRTRHPPSRPHPSRPPQQTATAADGTYPTWLHSCFHVVFCKNLAK